MTELYALPDHEVVRASLPDIERHVVPTDEAVERINNNIGIVPLAISHEHGGRIYWGDIGQYPFAEWQYIFTVDKLAREGTIADPFVTDMDILKRDDLATDGIYPSGFVFHISRCGSTLTGKALARTPRHLVLNQPAPLQRGFWAWLTDDWQKEAQPTEENLAMLRKLVLTMTRPRLGTEVASFVKFISWNVMYEDFIRQAFPDVPSLFLYRDPVEVIASVMKETTAVLLAKGKAQATFLTGLPAADTTDMSDVEFLSRCYAKYFETVLTNPHDGLGLINYTNINAGNFPTIVRSGLHYNAQEEDMVPMLEQFNFHSKDDSNTAKFKADSAEKQQSISDSDKKLIEIHCAGFVDRLDASPYNVFK